MKKTCKRFTLIICIFFQVILAKPILHHGIGFRLTNGGQGIYYELAANITRLNQLYSNYGLHIEQTQYRIDNFGQLSAYNQNNDLLFPFNLGIRNIIFDSKLDGDLRPFYFGELGIIGQLNNKIIKKWSNEWSLGLGIRFRSGRLLHRLYYGYNSSSIVNGNAMFGMIISWK